MQLTIGLLIPFLGTTIGSAMVFLMRKNINNRLEKFLLGFASGVMIAASVWSLIIPSIEMAKEQGVIAWLPASLGFLLGILFLMYLEKLVRKLEFKINKNDITTSYLKNDNINEITKIKNENNNKNEITINNYESNRKNESIDNKYKKTIMMILAVTIHNIPERNGCWSCFCWRFNG